MSSKDNSNQLNPYEFTVLCSRMHSELNEFDLTQSFGYSAVIAKAEAQNLTRDEFFAKFRVAKDPFFLFADQDHSNPSLASFNLSILDQ